MKAFLSHSSKERPLVDSVATKLGRQFCRFDKYHFETGEEFESAIKRCLDESALFVLFASKNSKESIWVNFEVQEAWHRKLREQIAKSLVYVIDDETEVSSLPEWIQRALVRKDKSANSIARDIRNQLDELLRSRRHPYFVGRSNDIARIEEAMTPIDGSDPPRGLLVFGLPGVGRRSLIRHAVPNVFGFRKFIEIRLEEGDAVQDICAKTADLIEPYSSQEEFVALFNEIQELNDDDAMKRTLTNLRSICDGGELPIITDAGGLLDTEGYIRTPASKAIESIGPHDTLYLALITHRKPQRSQDLAVPTIQLAPLGEADTKRLVKRLFNIREIDLTPEDLSEIAEYIAGYPPSAYFAAQQAKDYGVDLVVSHKQRLVEFRTGVFLKHIEALDLETLEGSVLQLLAAFSPLALPVIIHALEITLDQADEVLTRLIDLSLVIPDGDGLYRIAEPIQESATSTYGFVSPKLSERVASYLSGYIQTDISAHRRLDLNRVLFRAARFGSVVVSGDIVKLAADLVKLTEAHYHSREYARSVECGLLALEERPESITARSYLIRSLVQLERWHEAERQLTEMSKFAPGRDVHFLRGFYQRRKGHFKDAIAEYEQAVKLGRRGAAVGRELAHCYFMVGDLENANRRLQEVLRRHADNRYVVDLWVQIATEMGDIDRAREALQRLEVLDKEEFYLYRKSRVEWRFANVDDALSAIRNAVRLHERPSFQFLAQAVLCELGAGHLVEAERLLSILDTRFGDIRRDVRLGLRCRLLNASGRHDEALTLSERIADKESRYFQTIRYESLRGVLSNPQGSSDGVKNLRDELAALEESIGSQTNFDISELN